MAYEVSMAEFYGGVVLLMLMTGRDAEARVYAVEAGRWARLALDGGL